MDGPEPLLRVVRGTPTAEELAALVGALLTRATPAPPPDPAPPAWVRSGRPAAGRARLPADRGPLAWPGSTRPR
jgi:hypothetical protein